MKSYEELGVYCGGRYEGRILVDGSCKELKRKRFEFIYRGVGGKKRAGVKIER